jgi:hypothetical protein
LVFVLVSAWTAVQRFYLRRGQGNAGGPPIFV